MKPIPNFPDYQITRNGRVWSNFRRRWLRLKLNSDSYYILTARKDNRRVYLRVHRLVLETYVGPCPKGMECRHLNGIRTDNRLENLRWGTRSENIQDSKQHGTYNGGGQLGEKNKNAKLTKDKVRVIRYLRNVAKFSLKDIAWQFDVSVSAISEICSGRNWGWLSTI